MDAAQDSLGWVTKEGKLILSYGKNIVGNDLATAGNVQGLWFGYKVDGTKVMYRKITTKIQYLNGTTWTDIITGLTLNADYTFANYSSLSGAFTFVGGIDGIWKINNVNPANPINMTSSVNFKGKILIDKGRMLLWGRDKDKTGLYGSKIDPQNSTVYTTVTGEATASLTGTLAFKASHATANSFGVTVTLTGTGEVFTDGYLGALTGTLGGTGTINYITGAYTLSNSGVGTVAYQWEDSNSGGITDFRHTATRLAGEGFQFPQDEGGDEILNVLIGQDGTFYSEKRQSFYSLTIDATDLIADNLVYRKDLGILSFRGGISSNKGIVFMNTANSLKPEMTILQRSVTTTNVEPVILFPEFKFANYDYSDCAMDTWERYIIVLCKKQGSTLNDTILLCDMAANTVDAIAYSGRCTAKDLGNLYIGSSIIQNVYQVFNGFDDDGAPIQNYWIGKNDQYQMATGFARKFRYQLGESLKKFRKFKMKGLIVPGQNIEVYGSFDEGGFQLLGTIRGDGAYVDYSEPQTIGGSMVGDTQVGGDAVPAAYTFFTEFKVTIPKFRTRTIKLVATGIGYCEIRLISDWDILIFEERLPVRFRQKQQVSLDGKTTDVPEA